MRKETGRNIYPEWSLVYTDYDPENEKSRESLLATGNGYMGIRGAMEESHASDRHYPGTYVAGLYNRLISHVSDRDIENEDLVNLPHALFVTFRINGGEWFVPDTGRILKIRRELDFRNGLLLKEMVVEDTDGRQTEIVSQRLASMDNPHLAGIRYTVRPLNYSGQIEVLSRLDGRIINDGVPRYRSLNQQHLKAVDQGYQQETGWLTVQTVQSQVLVAMGARHEVRVGKRSGLLSPVAETEASRVDFRYACDLEARQILTLEKVTALYTSKPDDSPFPLEEALMVLESGLRFNDLLKSNAERWGEIWKRSDIWIEGDPKSQMLIRLHLYHLLVTASPHHVHIDAGIPARGLHGEAYRGHIFWDELYILPVYNLFFPDVARSVLRYRYRRLGEARKYARQHGYDGAMFPWQSGSDGREETQVVHLNPLSGEWGDDYSSLQRHISIAIAYNVWYYFQVTGDRLFMESEGAELFLDICRFWASTCQYNAASERYEISRVMGPDEFHEHHPLSDPGGVKDNAYTNLMVSWLFRKARDIFQQLSVQAQTALTEKLRVTPDELGRWQTIAGQLHLEMSDAGILAQFEGYFDLEELDWEAYRAKYGNIYRLDRILKAEGKSPDDYQLAKQADTLMTFYNLNEAEVSHLLADMGYPASENLLRDHYRYYIARTSHGSTLSRVVHAYLALKMGETDLAWELYSEALASDYTDIQGGTTAEGIHAGVMGGTVLMVMTGFAGFDFKADRLRIHPHLPAHWDAVSFRFEFRGARYEIRLTQSVLYIQTLTDNNQQTSIEFLNKTLVLQPGREYALEY